MNTKPGDVVKLVFFGSDDFCGPSLWAILQAGIDVLGVTKPDAPSGRGQKLQSTLLKGAGEKAGFQVLQPRRVTDIAEKLKAYRPTAGVLVSYGEIIPQSVIDIFPGGIINVHPSLLPKYRGPSPIESVILNGEDQTGISLMSLVAKMDAGPIYAQQTVPLTGKENTRRLYSDLSLEGAGVLIENLPKIILGRLPALPQDDSKATYSRLLKKEDGWIDSTKPAVTYERQVRAFIKWPKSRTQIYSQEIVITKARVADCQADGALVMKCQPGYLEILELTGPSGRSMSGADFIRGYKKA